MPEARAVFLSAAQEAGVPAASELRGVPVWGCVQAASRAAAGIAHRSVLFVCKDECGSGNLGLRERVLDLPQRWIWKASGARDRPCIRGARCSQDQVWDTGPRQQQPGGWDSEAELEFVPPHPTPGPDGAGAWRVHFKPELWLNSFTPRTLPEPTRRRRRSGGAEAKGWRPRGRGRALSARGGLNWPGFPFSVQCGSGSGSTCSFRRALSACGNFQTRPSQGDPSSFG